MPVIPLTYQPDLDCDWRTNPGALTYVANFAPSQSGALLTVGETTRSTSLTASGCDLNAYIFQKVDGTYRLLTFGTSNIDEYTNAWARTNRATGFGALAATDHWQAAAQGNAIVAVNYSTASQVSTGAGFAALGGGSPKAKCITANATFMMMGNYDDGANQYNDGWWCSAIGNYASWTTSAATQATNGRLLDAPGPITAMIAYKSDIIAFKENAMWVGTYVGTPVVWAWSLISNRIGCVGPNAVIEAGGRLWFCHSSGFYMYDGTSMPVNVGMPVFKSFLASLAHLPIAVTSEPNVSASTTKVTLGDVNTFADDFDNIVWFSHRGIVGSVNKNWECGYNYVTGKWGRIIRLDHSGFGGTQRSFYARANTSDLNGFLGTAGVRGMFFDAGNTEVDTISYPVAVTSGTGGATTGLSQSGIVTGPIGDDTSSKLNRITVIQEPNGSKMSATNSTLVCVAKGDPAALTTQTGGSTGVYNAEYDAFDIDENGRFHVAQIFWQSSAYPGGGSAVLGKVRGLVVDIEKHGKR